jgi:DNA-binding winged helix-turn-helix (wHTH) protein/Tfp pilus assembly protein PilF
VSIYRFGPFQLDDQQLLLTREGEPVALGPKVVQTLLALIEHPGEVIAKGALVDRIWPEGFVEEANLAQNVHVLRKTFRSHGVADPIETIPRRGYRFTGHVCKAADDSRGQAPGVRLSSVGTSKQARFHRLAAAVAGLTFLAASLVFAGSGFGHRAAKPGELSDRGAQLYQIGRYYWNLRTRDGVQKSLTYFAQVIDTDPQNARGYAGLADANATIGDYCYGTHRPSVYFARAREYAGRALELDPHSAEAHATLGILALDRKDTPAAVGELRKAIAFNPSYAPAQEWYGIALFQSGRKAEGVSHLKRAADLDPLSAATFAWLGSAAYLEGRFGDAVAYSQEALELSPRRTDALTTIGEAYEAQGDIDRAIDAFKRFGAVNAYYRPEAAALLAEAYALGHRSPEARAQFAYARTHASEVDPSDFATAAAAVGVSRSIDQRPDGHVRHGATYG